MVQRKYDPFLGLGFRPKSVLSVNNTAPDPAGNVAVEGGGGGGATITNVTYADLVALIGANGLTAFAQYRLTDFQTVHFFVDGNGDQHGINTGAVETLVLTASSTNEFFKNAYSESYPNDEIYYDWNPDNWNRDLALMDVSDESLIPNFKGFIFFRKDTLNNISVGYDFRNVKFRRWKVLAPAYNAGTTYADRVPVTYSNTVWVSMAAGNIGNTPNTTAGYWMRLWSVNANTHNNYLSTTPNKFYADSYLLGLNSASAPYVDPNDFVDVYTFQEPQNNTSGVTINDAVQNVFILPRYDNYDEWFLNGSALQNNVFYIYDSVSIQISSVIFNQESYSNTFVSEHGYGCIGSTTFNSTYCESLWVGNNLSNTNTFNGYVKGCYFGTSMQFNVFDAFTSYWQIATGFKNNVQIGYVSNARVNTNSQYNTFRAGLVSFVLKTPGSYTEYIKTSAGIKKLTHDGTNFVAADIV